MLNDYLDGLITNPPDSVWLLIPALAFLESCVGIGLLVSGVLLLSASSVLYANNVVELGVILPLAFCGAFLGDQTGYWLGRSIGPRIWQAKVLKKRQTAVSKVEALFLQSAPWAICIGRLVPALRSLTPIAAGVSGLTPARFVSWDIIACTIWMTGLFGLLLLIVG